MLMRGWGMGSYILLCPFRHGVWALLTALCLSAPFKGPGLSVLNTKAEVRSWEDLRSGHPKSAPGKE